MKKIIASLMAVGFIIMSTASPISSVLAETASGHGTPSGNRPTPSGNDPVADACRADLIDGMGFCEVGSWSYWFENSKRQGRYGDPKNIYDSLYGIERGREIYDPVSNAWYWLDAVNDGAKAVGKEVWMPYVYQDEDSWIDSEKAVLAQESDAGMAAVVLDAMLTKSGKWVRYDQNGAMLKGWVTIEGELAKIYSDQAGNTYYYDTRTGIMAKGDVTIDGTPHHFDEITGVLIY